MSDEPGGSDAAYHLHLEGEEPAVTASALRLLVSDEAHQPTIRSLAREVIAAIDASVGEAGVTLALSEPQLKITHTAVHLLFNDLQRGQAEEIEVLRAVLAKLPDEHAIRAILID